VANQAQQVSANVVKHFKQMTHVRWSFWLESLTIVIWKMLAKSCFVHFFAASAATSGFTFDARNPLSDSRNEHSKHSEGFCK
jgi:hypothetical protein